MDPVKNYIRSVWLIACLAIWLSSCAHIYLMPFGGHTDALSVETTGVSKKVIWQRLLRMTSEHGLAIDTLDYDRGVFVSGKISFADYYCASDSLAERGDAIFQKQYYRDRLYPPAVISGNLQINLSGENPVKLMITSEHVSGYETVSTSHCPDRTERYHPLKAASTGRVEGRIARYLSGADTFANLRLYNGERENLNCSPPLNRWGESEPFTMPVKPADAWRRTLDLFAANKWAVHLIDSANMIIESEPVKFEYMGIKHSKAAMDTSYYTSVASPYYTEITGRIRVLILPMGDSAEFMIGIQDFLHFFSTKAGDIASPTYSSYRLEKKIAACIVNDKTSVYFNLPLYYPCEVSKKKHQRPTLYL